MNKPEAAPSPGLSPATSSETLGWLAMLAALWVPIAYASTATTARLSMLHGTSPLTMAATRQYAATLAFSLLMLWLREPLRIPLRQALIAWGLGAGQAIYSWCLYLSFEHLPVALAILAFYTYPLLTALLGWASGQQRPDRYVLLALLLAFAGLALALGGDVAAGNAQGLLLVLAAAAIMAISMLLISKLFQAGDSKPRIVHMLWGATFTYSLLLGWHEAPQWPQDDIGWIAMAVCAGIFCFALIGILLSVSRLGSLQAALIMNVEPIVAAILGWWLLGQTLGLWQLLGGLVIMLALLLSRWPALRKPKQNPR